MSRKVDFFGFGRRVENKKGGIASTFFAPNLTMNLTYLCYGNTKVGLLVAHRIKTR
jgi:hypothetical protein